MSAEPDVRARLAEIYTDLHRHPELSMQEFRTAGVIAEFLRGRQLEVLEKVGGTGVIGIHRNGAGPTVYVRADMDGLPVTEETGLDYASVEPGVMHACGHDMHVTCLLGAVEAMQASEDQWRGTVVYLFQPGEETGEGAAAMLADPRMAELPRPVAVIGQHVMPAPSGQLLTRPGVLMAGSDSLRVTMHGIGGHGSQPESTVDPVYMAASTVVRLQSIVSREVPPATPVVVTVGSMQAGTKENIIPATATLSINVRSFSPESREQVLASIHRIAKAEALASAAPREPDFDTLGEFPVTVNDAGLAEQVAEAFTAEFGTDKVGRIDPVNASEDFGRFGTHYGVPSLFWFLGGAGAEEGAEFHGVVDRDTPSNHSPHYAPVIHPTIESGVRALTVAARTVLAAPPTTTEASA
ncbi:amidohydrolase [Nocardioides sp.]|uniref:amidohydrolase n=1 Tax=Nocardioides sp. TaxID=35761 RepID=UPI0039E7037D